MRRLALAIPFVLASAAIAQEGGLVLDDFDSAINDELGGARALSLEVLANPFSQLTKFEVSPGYSFAEITGAAVFNSGLAARQTGTLAWDNGGAGLGLDVSAFDGLELDFLQVDQDFAMSVQFKNLGSGATADWFGTVNATAEGETLTIDFGDLVTTGEFDLTSIGSIRMLFNAGESPVSSLDFVLTEFRAGSVIPTPGSVAVLGLSGLALGRRRRR